MGVRYHCQITTEGKTKQSSNIQRQDWTLSCTTYLTFIAKGQRIHVHTSNNVFHSGISHIVDSCQNSPALSSLNCKKGRRTKKNEDDEIRLF